MAKEKKYQLALRSKFNPALLPAISNLVALGMSEADVGIILGYSGKNPREWLAGLKKRNVDVREACEVGRKMANIALVSRAWQLAMEGYEYEEVETTQKFYDKFGNLYEKPLIIEIKTKKKFAKPNNALLQTLLRSRLPQDFSQKIQIDKRTLNIDMDSEDEVNSFFGNLIDRKSVESCEVKGIDDAK